MRDAVVKFFLRQTFFLTARPMISSSGVFAVIDVSGMYNGNQFSQRRRISPKLTFLALELLHTKEKIHRTNL